MSGTATFLRRRRALPDDVVATSNDERPRRRRRRAAALALALGSLGAGWLALSWFVGADNPGKPRAARAGATATVARRTLVERESVTGTLGYADSRTLVNRLGDGGGSSGGGAGTPDGSDSGSGGGGATLTRTARPGSIVRRGGALYWVNGEPVLLMYGATPAYRTLKQGVADGADVAQLEANLAALGFDPGTVDDEFTSSTAAAVRIWQESLGVGETGRAPLGRVVFLPGARRIGARKTAVGQALAETSEVLETTSTRRVVTVELDVAKQSLARRGDGVRVTLPGGATVRGRIARVGHVAHSKSGTGDGGSSGGGDGSSDEELVVDVSIVLRSARGIGRFDQAPVSVAIASEKRRNALVVPVEALLARRGGGYAVELAAGGRLVRVRTGLFADGFVEVSGGGIRAGTRVAVPQ
jgi:peptidoglycan hydrolase-like protein with peptidoglycan-binding domain